MNFADHTPEKQGQIVSRAWSAIKLDIRAMEDSAIDELMAEWIDGLQGLTLAEIKVGVTHCKTIKRSVPIDEFVGLCVRNVPEIAKPKPGDSAVARREKERMRRVLAGDSDETKAESWDKLGLSRTHGPLPKEPVGRLKRRARP